MRLSITSPEVTGEIDSEKVYRYDVYDIYSNKTIFSFTTRESNNRERIALLEKIVECYNNYG